MLEEIRIDNFKSLINVVFQPRQLNLLLGVNNSGKTNLCHALRFLSGTMRGTLDQCAEQTVGSRAAITNHYFAKDTMNFELQASLPFEGEVLSYAYALAVSVQQGASFDVRLEVQEETLEVTGEDFVGVSLLQNTGGHVRLLNESEFLRGPECYQETSAPMDTTMLSRLYDPIANTRAIHFKQYLSCWQYYSFSESALRGSRHQPHHRQMLHTDGANLASVIYGLKTTDERRYRRLLGYLQAIDPTIDLINFQVASENRVFMVFEDAKGNALPVTNASNGTLRFLALLYVLVAQPSVVPSSLVMIEEPENGIYVGLLEDLVAMASESELRPEAPAEDAELPPQVIFTSHSPYFIDLFDSRLDNVFLMKRGEQHSSIVQPDVEQVKKRLERFPLGEQHFREMLG